jgi:hypothetical protein
MEDFGVHGVIQALHANVVQHFKVCKNPFLPNSSLMISLLHHSRSYINSAVDKV